MSHELGVVAAAVGRDDAAEEFLGDMLEGHGQALNLATPHRWIEAEIHSHVQCREG